jgi:hypothetical protein
MGHPGAPREDYSVFSESDFISGAEGADVFARAGGGDRGRRLGQIVGPAVLAAVLAAIVAMLLVHHRPVPAPGRPLGRGAVPDAAPAKAGLQVLAAPARVLAPKRDPRVVAAAGRPPVPAVRSSTTVAGSVRDPGKRSDERAAGALTQAESAEFGFER